MKDAEIVENVRRLVVDWFLDEADAPQFRNDEDLTTVVNSIELLRLVLELEHTFGVKIENTDLNLDNLGTIERIAAFVARKQAGAVS